MEDIELCRVIEYLFIGGLGGFEGGDIVSVYVVGVGSLEEGRGSLWDVDIGIGGC